MKDYLISYETNLGWVIELNQSDLSDRPAIVLEDHEQVNEFLQEFGHVYQNSLSHDWSF
jgi:hypothetical protein